MSAIAHILVVGGNTVSGSDQADSTILAKLRDQGCSIDVGHDAAAVNGADLVVISTAVKPGNVEYDAALALGIPIATRNEMMTAFGAQRRTLAISGTHGKTTTSGMAAVVLMAAQWNPSFIVECRSR
jgi:UDP-N-acetylmuramate--alanine ligase